MEVAGTSERLAQLRAQPWAPPLLEAVRGIAGLHLVGGAVRDLLLGRDPVDLDLVVEGDAPAVAAELAARLGGRHIVHPRFGTATVRSDALTFDLVTARAERYPEPGALPEVRAGTLAEDLARRDFTINAIAMALEEARRGELEQFPGALDDLAAGAVRVLHPGSFRDDPTRLVRAARYAGRLGFALEPGTEELARAAIAAGALSTVSGPRVRDELLDALGEPAAGRVLGLLADLGLDAALGLRARPDLVEAAWELVPPEARRDLLALAACALEVPDAELRDRLDALGLTAGERGLVLATAAGAPELARRLGGWTGPDSELAAAVGAAPAEAVALAGALGAEPAARRWLEELRHVGLEITGADLVAAGVPEGPAVGRGLRAALAHRLDGEAQGRDAQLAAALAAARAE